MKRSEAIKAAAKLAAARDRLENARAAAADANRLAKWKAIDLMLEEARAEVAAAAAAAGIRTAKEEKVKAEAAREAARKRLALAERLERYASRQIAAIEFENGRSAI